MTNKIKNIYSRNRLYASIFVVIFALGGYLLLKASFAASTFTVISPASGSVVNTDFPIRTRFYAESDITSKLNIVLTLDGRTIMSKVINTGGTFRAGQYFDYYFSGGLGGANLFPIKMLRPGAHTLRTEVRFGETIGQGDYLNSYASSFNVQTTNLIAAGENPLTVSIADLPKSGGLRALLSPHKSTTQNKLSSLSSEVKTSVNLATKKLAKTVFPKAQAHTCDGCRHGDINVIATLSDGTPVQGVGVNVSHPSLDGCHSGTYYSSTGKYINNGTTNSGGSVYFTGCAVSNNGCLNDPLCAATYTITITSPPPGYTLVGSNVTTSTIVWNQVNTVRFYFTKLIPPSPTCNLAPTPYIANNVRTPLYRFWSNPWTDHVYQTVPMDQGGLNAGYCYEGNEGWLYPNQIPGTIELARYFNPDPAIMDHFYLAGRNDAIVPSAWHYEGPTGYISSTQQAGTIPLYRFYNDAVGYKDHFYGTNYNEGIYAGYTYEGIVGYVWTGAGSYSPVYNQNPANGPLISVSNLGSTYADVYAFGYKTYNNLPANYLSKVTLSIDGDTPQTIYISGSYPAIGPIRFSFPNLDDGETHGLIFSAINQNGLGNEVTIMVNPRTNLDYIPYDPPPADAPDDPAEIIAIDASLGQVRHRAKINWSWPLGKSYAITGCWNEPRPGHRHAGLDISAGLGTTVKAVARGQVVKTGYENGYGNHVIIKHYNGKYSLYGHLSKISVSNWQNIHRGDKVGEVGNTGGSYPYHLHVNIQNINSTGVAPNNGSYSTFNPLRYLPRDHRVQAGSNKCIEADPGYL